MSTTFFTKAETLFTRWVLRVASNLLDQPVALANKQGVPTTVAGSVVLWYWEDGRKHYVMVKNTKTKDIHGSLRFPSFYGLLAKKDAASTLKASLTFQFGERFVRKLDDFQLSFANIAAAPTFFWQNEANKAEETVQMLIWQHEIQPRWVKAIQAADGLAVQVIPDFSIAGKRIAPAHKMIHKNLERAMEELEKYDSFAKQCEGIVVSGDAVLENLDQIEDLVDEIYEAAPKASRIIH